MRENLLPEPAQVLTRPVRLADIEAFCAAAIDYAKAGKDDARHVVAVRLPFLDLTVRSSVRAYAGTVRERLRPAPAGEGAGQLEIVVLSAGSGLIGRPPRWGEAVLDLRELELALAGSRYRASYSHDWRLWQILDIETGTGLQWMADDDALPPWDRGAPLRTFLHWAYGRRGMRLAHAGTLGLDGEGILLTGRGGSGKSGTVTGGVLGGFESVGDDYVLIANSGSDLVAHCLFPTLKQDRDGLARLGLADKLAGRPANWQDKIEFSARDIGIVELADTLRIRGIVVAQLGDRSETRVSEISGARAMMSLAPTGLFQMPADRDSGVAFYAEMVRKLPCRLIELGSDPAGVNGAIGAIIRELRA